MASATAPVNVTRGPARTPRSLRRHPRSRHRARSRPHHEGADALRPTELVAGIAIRSKPAVSALADAGASITTEAALAKMIAADNCNEVCQKALNIFGGYGLMTDFPAERFLRELVLSHDRRRNQRHHAPDRRPPTRPVRGQ